MDMDRIIQLVKGWITLIGSFAGFFGIVYLFNVLQARLTSGDITIDAIVASIIGSALLSAILIVAVSVISIWMFIYYGLIFPMRMEKLIRAIEEKT